MASWSAPSSSCGFCVRGGTGSSALDSVEVRPAELLLKRPSNVGKGPAATSACGDAGCATVGGEAAEADSGEADTAKKAALGVFGVLGVLAPRFTNLGVSLEPTLCLEAALVRKRSVAAMALALHAIPGKANEISEPDA